MVHCYFVREGVSAPNGLPCPSLLWFVSGIRRGEGMNETYQCSIISVDYILMRHCCRAIRHHKKKPATSEIHHQKKLNEKEKKPTSNDNHSSLKLVGIGEI